MKVMLSICVLALLAATSDAKDQTAEELANSILRNRVASSLRIGLAKPNDDVFLMELDVNTYQAALYSKDMKLKALLAVKAIKTMPHFVKEGETPLSKHEKEKRFRKNPQYKKLKAWYVELIHKKK